MKWLMKIFFVGMISALGNAYAAEASVTESVEAYASDAAITAKVKTLLLNDKQVSGLAVTVVTNDRTVQLSGFVKSEDEKQRAETIARGVEGVKTVKNDIVVNK